MTTEQWSAYWNSLDPASQAYYTQFVAFLPLSQTNVADRSFLRVDTTPRTQLTDPNLKHVQLPRLLLPTLNNKLLTNRVPLLLLLLPRRLRLLRELMLRKVVQELMVLFHLLLGCKTVGNSLCFVTNSIFCFSSYFFASCCLRETLSQHLGSRPATVARLGDCDSGPTFTDLSLSLPFLSPSHNISTPALSNHARHVHEWFISRTYLPNSSSKSFKTLLIPRTDQHPSSTSLPSVKPFTVSPPLSLASTLSSQTDGSIG